MRDGRRLRSINRTRSSELAEVGKAFSTQLLGLLPLLASFFTFEALHGLAHKAMPECIEHTRLVKLQRPHRDAQDALIEQVMSTPALT